MKQQHPTALNHRNEKGQFLKGIAPANKGNLTGMRFGNLLVIREDARRIPKRVFYLCRCDCGKEKIVEGTKLSSGHTKSCGCLRNRIKNIAGERFGRAIAINHLGFNKFGIAVWLCKCDCGTIFHAPVNGLSTGQNKSCGCLRLDRIRESALRNRADLTGKIFGKWTVMSRGKKYLTHNGNRAGYFWKCRCECGKEKMVHEASLKNGDSASCGCVNHVLPENMYSTKRTDAEKLRIYRKFLTNAAVRALLRGNGWLNSEITEEIINIKRQQIIMKRTLKQFKKWRKENESDYSVIHGQQHKDETVNEGNRRG
jgi:hypothetical protein